ncbi:MerR family transcriptional regulator [Micromonospora okii]|uniref:MerR family transcriptional regulator n=1 Tax=Micromonospora okii TaxID=1182970 RepID=UPI001E6534A2|nr:MerR family transcriptional regulator [Micromonospora okii]
MAGFSDDTISIGELSDRTGVSVRALRYYEQHGLLTADRTGTNHRRFRPDAIETVRRIRMFLDAGLPLAVVSQVMPCFVDDGARLHACVAEYLQDHMEAVRERIEELDEQRGTIERLQQLLVA